MRHSTAGLRLLRLGVCSTALLTGLASAQETPALPDDGALVILADEVSYTAEPVVTRATGNAEVYYGQTGLAADEIVYDVDGAQLSATGNVLIVDPSGYTLQAERVELDEALENGLVVAPAATFPQGGKLAAVEGQRIDGRYNSLSKAAFSACDVSPEDPVPLWCLKARRVVHDEEARRIAYEGAHFELLGVPVFYMPYFSHADPTVKRESGFLTPDIGTSDTYGYRVKLPYYHVIAPDRDLTITPFMTSNDGLIMEGEYRALTDTGDYLIKGSITSNDTFQDTATTTATTTGTGDEQLRGHLDAFGNFALTEDTSWGFDINLATDDTYLRRYDFKDTDRQTSEIFVRQQNETRFAEGNALYFQSYRADEPDETIPVVAPELRLREVVMEDADYGVATLTAHGSSLYRQEGRDVQRGAVGMEWERQFIAGPGVSVTPFAVARGDLYYINDDPAQQDGLEVRGNVAGGVDARWPVIAEAAGITHIVEPIVQAVVAPYGNGLDIPNEDSVDIEFDETTLFSRTNRFPGIDRWESGPRLNAGVRYELSADNGTEFGATYGRVFRLKANEGFSDVTGLRDASSDHVMALDLSLPFGVSVAHRMRLDDDTYTIRRNEVSGVASFGPASLSASYAFLDADPASGATSDRSEALAYGALDVRKYWTLFGGGRHDLEAHQTIDLTGGLRYADECLRVEFSATKRFNSDRDAESSTGFGLKVELLNIGA